MQDFLHNIFSRGSSANTNSPVVVVGGVSSNSQSLTYDVLHFDTTGALIVSGAVGGGSGTATSNVIASQSGSWTVAVSGGTMSVLWAQRLDATNDAITVYQNVSNSNWTVIASQSGSWTVAGVITAGTVTAIVSAGTVTAVVSAGTMTAIGYGQARTTDIAPAAANGVNTPIITDSLGKQVVLPGAINDLNMNGQVEIAQIAAAALIATPGAGRRIAMQSLLVTASGSQIVRVVISGGPSSRTFGFVTPTGGFTMNAGGAPLYITSASTNLSVALDATSTCIIFASGYNMSN